MNFERNEIIESINIALAESFEGLAFIEFDSWNEVDEIPESVDKHYITSVHINDPFKANLKLICSEKFTKNVIESITGEEVTDDESMISDTINEILNTFAGRFMVNLLSKNAEFDFGIPDFKQYQSNSIKILENDIIIRFVYEEDAVYCVFNNM